jgi:hypothetical protein
LDCCKLATVQINLRINHSSATDCHFLMAISLLRGRHEEAGSRYRSHRIDRNARFCG